MSNRITWQTGRIYSEHGQRIAAATTGNGVFMVDIDRMVSLFLPLCPLSEWAIMARYDSNVRAENWPSHLTPDEYVTLRAELEALAAAAPSITR